MRTNQAVRPIRVMARVLRVSVSGFYAWRSRQPSKRQRSDAALLRRIRTIHAVSHKTYGAPRVHAELRAEGVQVGRKRVARLMREAGIAGVSRRRRTVTTTVPAPEHTSAGDLVRRDFTADGPNRLWVADITFVPTAAGFLFLAVVLDAWSRRIVGWAFSHDLKTRLVLDALDMAVASRKPKDVIHHSDKGSQYTSWAFGHRCRAAGIRPSTGTAGDALDNAMCESFFATLECELIDRHRFATKAEAQIAVFRFIEGFYNPSRRYSSIGYLSPAEFEAAHQPDRAPTATPKPETCP
ncbi:putative transposase [Jannaschia seohaensis]|uniref:Putative transposase n=1 Tax=Jannaschia seohaensis TaxID=475081 RepID=A0A2Y9ADL2_9RHOB|nr:putative transposase [Jannaschia seohaensis]SSA42006.1 putative transposase [Jannaschia seohaensis]